MIDRQEEAALMAAGLTQEEAGIVADLADVWTRFVKLDAQHEVNDAAEVCAAIHLIQDKMFARPALRAYWKAGGG
jgi:hypothetical protein